MQPPKPAQVTAHSNISFIPIAFLNESPRTTIIMWAARPQVGRVGEAIMAAGARHVAAGGSLSVTVRAWRGISFHAGSLARFNSSFLFFMAAPGGELTAGSHAKGGCENEPSGDALRVR